MTDEHGITPPLEQTRPLSDPGPHNQPTIPGTLRPVSKLQEEDVQDHAGHPERAPYEIVPDGDTLGLEHVAVALRDLVYPIDRASLIDRAGRWRIPTTGTHFHTLADYLDGVDKRRFSSAEAVVNAIRRAHPDLRP